MTAGRTSPRGASDSRARWLVPGAFAVAMVFRLVGLGGSSMWLDEIMETLMARDGLGELFPNLFYDRAQPPIEPLFTWMLLALGQGELVRRLINAVLGAAAVALFARWVARRFDLPTAALTALFLAASPLLVRYSHELRPYALSLLFSVWALDAGERWLERGADRFPVELACAAGLAAMTHYLAVALWLPVAAAWFEARSAGRVAPLGVRLPAAMGLALLPLAAWFALLAAYGGPRQSIRTAQWDWALVERRFDDLLFRGSVDQPVIAGGAMLMALLTVVGFGVLARRYGGLTVFSGLFAGTVAVEVALLTMGRFSNVRYNQFGLLFLLTAIAAGIVACARLLGAFNRSSGFATATLLGGAVVATFLTGLVAYSEHGRPDWPSVSRAVVALRGPDAYVVTTNQWAQISLGYYLERYRVLREPPRRIVTVLGDRGRVLEEIAGQPQGCVLVLDAGFQMPEGLLEGLRPRHPIVSLPDTNRARLFQFASGKTPRQACFPPPEFRLEPSPGYGSLLPWLAGRGAARSGRDRELARGSLPDRLKQGAGPA
ncbi:MAG: glycosyltransferase family 39 protein [Thermoanaerobaculia bacterium]